MFFTSPKKKRSQYISEKTPCQEPSCPYNVPLMKHCVICDKKPIVGNSIARRGLAKKKGGVGKKITGITRRRFFPNLQRIKVRFPNGTVRRVLVCVSCIQAGKVRKAVSYRKPVAKAAV